LMLMLCCWSAFHDDGLLEQQQCVACNAQHATAISA
jgi:hypothetical protein